MLGGLAEDVSRSGRHFDARPVSGDLFALKAKNFSRIEGNDFELRRLGQGRHDFERVRRFRLDRDGAEAVEVERLLQPRVLLFQLLVLLRKVIGGFVEKCGSNENFRANREAEIFLEASTF